MNWILLGVILYILFSLGTLIFFSVDASRHPNRLRASGGLRAKIESFMRNLVETLGYIVMVAVALNLLFGFALIIWVIIKIIEVVR